MTSFLSPEAFAALPLLPMTKVDLTAPTAMSPLQLQMLPWLGMIHTFWWGLFIATTAYLVWHYLAKPSFVAAKPIKATKPTTKAATKTTKADWLDRFFSLQEIRDDLLLRWFGGAILIGYTVTFASWWGSMNTTPVALERGTVNCWPFFQSCGDWLWLQLPPDGYSQSMFYALLLGTIILAAWGLVTNRIRFAHLCFGVLLLAKGYLSLQNYTFKGNFDYYHTTFALIYLLLPHKRFFGSLSIPLFYYLSTVAKIHPSWTLGGYFSSMTLGLPLFPLGSEPIPTNLLIFMEMVFGWFLFSHRPKVQRVAFWFFVGFHLYSSILVGYRYPVTVLPVLMVFFGPFFKPFKEVPNDRAAIPGWLAVGTLFFLQFIPVAIPGDEKMTMEGNFYGLYMFEANHQCQTRYSDGTGNTMLVERESAPRNRCDPWDALQVVRHRYCNNPKAPGPIGLEILHSINGGPFYQIVNERDACKLTFKPFSKNHWIKDTDTAPAVGRPYMNYYR